MIITIVTRNADLKIESRIFEVSAPVTICEDKLYYSYGARWEDKCASSENCVGWSVFKDGHILKSWGQLEEIEPDLRKCDEGAKSLAGRLFT